MSSSDAGTPDRPSRAEAEAVYEQIKAILASAAGDAEMSRRLARAETSVDVELSDAPGEPLVLGLRLDRLPVEVVAGGLPHAEVRLCVRVRDVLPMWLGEILPAIAIVEGSASYEGPVRKLLRVLPMMRALAQRYVNPPAPPGGVQGS